MRIGFLFNHDQVHQVRHSLPIGLALLDQCSGAEPVFASTNPAITVEIRKIASECGHHRLAVTELSLHSPLSCGLDHLLGGVLPTRKILVYRDNLAFFEGLDALVVSERTSLMLKTRYGMSELPILLADHGAGDRAIGFNKVSARFDHVLAAGPKIRDRLIQDAGVDPARITITGYPKFDVCRDTSKLPFQANGHPTVLYNPHVSPHLSSWYDRGRDVLDFFLRHPEYNLIFAPHVMLFQRSWVVSIDKLRLRRAGSIERKYLDAPNIHVDLGSAASTDMTYTNSADIYLGDVSSQVYEFIRTPRPCIFLNTTGADHLGDPNFAHWAAGPVISGANELSGVLEAAACTHYAYRAAQQELFHYTFDLTHEASSARAARMIMRLVRQRKARTIAIDSSRWIQAERFGSTRLRPLARTSPETALEQKRA